jgi:hypothetical protein
MLTVEFQAKIAGSSIELPDQVKESLSEDDVVTVIVKKGKNKKTGATGCIAELMKNPVNFSGKPLSRDEIYDRIGMA